MDINGGSNHVGNFCDSPILADIENDKIIINSSYYYIAHFSRFIKLGARRIECSAIDEALSTAFLNADGTVVLVV